jgi:hypothetical protein
MGDQAQEIHEKAAARIVHVLGGRATLVEQLVLIETAERLARRSARNTGYICGAGSRAA